MNDTITISKDEYLRLQFIQAQFQMLEDGGVETYITNQKERVMHLLKSSID